MTRRSIDGCRGILTGGSSGIGYALATQLVRQGARLLVVARRAERLEQLTSSLVGATGRIETLVGDISRAEIRAAALDRARQLFGGLDLLVNNAGSGAMGRFADAAPERLRQIMEINFFAPAEMIRLAVPLLREGNRPIVVNVGSILGHRGIPGCAEYCASKFALQGFSESLRAELAPQRIDVLMVSPGTTQTEFFESAINPGEAPWRRTGVAPDVVARRAIAAIRSGRHEIVIGPSGKLLVWMNRLFPAIADRILARYG